MSRRYIATLTILTGVALAQPPKALVVLNAASGADTVAPESIASAFGLQIGTSTQSVLTLTLPTSLGGLSVELTDSAKAKVLGPLFYVSPNQINFVVPGTVATGTATATIMNGAATPPSVSVMVAKVAPGLFTANGSGTGVPAALAIRRAIATQTDTTVPVFTCSANACVSTPIETSSDTQVFLALFGTGIRGRTSLANVTAAIGGQAMVVLFAGAQGQYQGLDQVNVQLPQTTTVHGEQDLVLTVDGKAANTVRVNMK